MTGDFIYSNRQNRQDVARGSVTATIFGPGAANASQVNPFFQLPAALAGATSAQVLWQADELLGRGAHIDSAAETFYSALKADYTLGEKWTATVGMVLGRDVSRQQNVGQLCVSCAYLAINGTTNSGGSTTTVSIPGTSTAVLGLPLTANNALDVFNALSQPKTKSTNAAPATPAPAPKK